MSVTRQKSSTIPELQQVIRSSERLQPRGAGSKSALESTDQDVTLLEVAGLRGVLDYEPQEFTFTALAGTPLAEVEQMLAENGQYLPFDPPFVEGGATLGGTVAAGLSGPGRYRYGGVRDFLLGVKFLDGRGELVRSGGVVVKNAAGFDISKLMVGSLGGYGLLAELSFKVFPAPRAFTTAIFEYQTLSDGLDALVKLARSSIEIFALDLEPHPNHAELVVRLGGIPEGFPARLGRLRSLLGADERTTLDEESERAFWRSRSEFAWHTEGQALVKVPLTPGRLLELDNGLAEYAADRHYSVGANLGWVAWSGPLNLLDSLLTDLGLSGLVLLGSAGKPRLGTRTGEGFAARVKKALDPLDKWVTF